MTDKPFTDTEVRQLAQLYPELTTTTPEGRTIPTVSRQELHVLAARYPSHMLDPLVIPKTGDANEDELRARYPSMYARK